MYKLIIAEDIAMIREMLSKHISWKEHRIQLVSCVSNGAEALSYIKKNPVDILLTDIKMPVMDGLKLIMEAVSLYPDLKSIILTAYANFEYAKNAIHLGVCNYILKPIDVNQLLSTVDSIVQELEEQKKIKTKIDEYDRLVAGSPENPENSLLKNCSDAGKVKIVKTILSYIETADLSMMKISDIADYINLNPKYLSSIFKTVTQQNLSSYITSFKMEQAAKLLRVPNSRVYEICAQLGYSDQNHFRDVFCKYHGMSPAEYKKKVF